MYFAEKDESGWTFIDAFWFSLMTLTTVGYDMHPTTFVGKVGDMNMTDKTHSLVLSSLEESVLFWVSSS